MENETAFVNPLIPFIRIFLHLSPEKTIKLFGERLPPNGSVTLTSCVVC